MKEKKKAVDAARPKLKRSISRTLLTVILPVVTIGILAIIVFLNQQASA